MESLGLWVMVAAMPFLVAWCVGAGRGFGAVVAVLTGALGYVVFVYAAGAVLGLALTVRAASIVWLVGVVAVVLMRRNVNRLGLFVCRLTGAPVPPRVGQDIRKIPVEHLIRGFSYPKGGESAEGKQ